MSEKTGTISIRQLRSSTTTKRIMAGERLTLCSGDKPIAEIIPLPAQPKTLDEIIAPVRAISAKIKPSERRRSLVLEDRERFRR